MSGPPLICIDTSALGALLIEQAETAALIDWFDTTVSSMGLPKVHDRRDVAPHGARSPALPQPAVFRDTE